jgi:hypothetical protein
VFALTLQRREVPTAAPRTAPAKLCALMDQACIDAWLLAKQQRQHHSHGSGSGAMVGGCAGVEAGNMRGCLNEYALSLQLEHASQVREALTPPTSRP